MFDNFEYFINNNYSISTNIISPIFFTTDNSQLLEYKSAINNLEKDLKDSIDILSVMRKSSIYQKILATENHFLIEDDGKFDKGHIEPHEMIESFYSDYKETNSVAPNCLILDRYSSKSFCERYEKDDINIYEHAKFIKEFLASKDIHFKYVLLDNCYQEVKKDDAVEIYDLLERKIIMTYTDDTNTDNNYSVTLFSDTETERIKVTKEPNRYIIAAKYQDIVINEDLIYLISDTID